MLWRKGKNNKEFSKFAHVNISSTSMKLTYLEKKWLKKIKTKTLLGDPEINWGRIYSHRYKNDEFKFHIRDLVILS